MKKIIFSIITVFSLFLLTGCDNDDDKGIDQKNSPFVGNWYLSKIGEVETINGENHRVYTDYEACATDKGNYLFFTQNTFQAVDYDSENGCSETVISGNYTYNANQLTMYYQENDAELIKIINVLNLTQNALEIQFTNEATGEMEFNILEKK